MAHTARGWFIGHSTHLNKVSTGGPVDRLMNYAYGFRMTVESIVLAAVNHD
jgi:hypothetical protein